MICETIIHKRPSRESGDIIRNGMNRCGGPQCRCEDCGACRILKPKKGRPPEERKKWFQPAGSV